MQWFGEPFPSRATPAAMFHDGQEIPRPAHPVCEYCELPIEPGELGLVGAYFNLPTAVHHYECFMRPIIGSVTHQRGSCSCFVHVIERAAVDSPTSTEPTAVDFPALRRGTTENRRALRADALAAFAEFERGRR